MISGDVKWGAFHASEVFILPSHQENFGIAVVEAMACGVPVLISNKVNIWREIDLDKAGLIENNGLDGTVRLLKRWLALTESEKSLMRQHAKSCFLNRFEIGHATAGFVETLRAFGVADNQ
jgi:glycosyltransferase involved in cell wall biosynthesis